MIISNFQYLISNKMSNVAGTGAIIFFDIQIFVGNWILEIRNFLTTVCNK